MLNPKLNHYLETFESFFKDLLEKTAIPAPRLKKAILYTLFPGGKRIRPLLVYLCGEVLNTNPVVLNYIAAAIELIHSYSLVHDDLPAMDNDDFRRGKLSCHKAFDEATAILVGDALQTMAYETLLEQLPGLIEPTSVITILNELTKASGAQGMVSGQSLDLSELIKHEIKEDELRLIHELKTGKLISACFSMVILSDPINKNRYQCLLKFANLLGLVFQMQDDYLDKYHPKAIGKIHSSDHVNNKWTFACLYSQENLLEMIDLYFQESKKILLELEEKGSNLQEIIRYLEARMRSI